MLTSFGTISLGQLITTLKQSRPDADVRFDFGYFRPGDFDSYRGYYDHLAINYAESHEGERVADFVARLERRLGSVFTGYKGGEFRMHTATPVWVANYSECPSTGIVGVGRPRDSLVILETNYVP